MKKIKKIDSVTEARAGLIPQSYWDEKEANYRMHVGITVREWDTMLAALRLWQHEASHIADGDGALSDIASEHDVALTNEEIDGLCERINTSPVPTTPIDIGREALRSNCLTLVEYLQEAHEPDRANVVNGRNHSGDGVAGCSYCQAIKEARASLKKY